MLTHNIRDKFLSFFHQNGHVICPSAPLVPHQDPSLLFVNAGMVPFKNSFTGLEPSPFPRAVSVQKCLRAGGKHNDLDNVGYTARHHTFFEMLGNFSFGDYFKEEAIFFAWSFLTREMGISPDRLWVTVYADDHEARTLWKKITGFGDDKIISIGTADNFWSMGDTGPCGPCTEIFYDHGDHVPGGLPGHPDQDGDRFVEIWNLVFMQFDQKADGTRIPLPYPAIDTGMGMERLAAVMQGVVDNYDTDLFRALIDEASQITHVSAHGQLRTSFKVIADHVRASAFLIADGVLPSNEGRGYVLRRILRRAMRHAYFLGARDPLIAHLTGVLSDVMGTAYPELKQAQSLISATLNGEEVRFHQTLEKGLGLLTQEVQALSSDRMLPGDVAFKLYDTFGFPLDLTQDILREQGCRVDVDGFHTIMDQQKAVARGSWVGSGETSADTFFTTLKGRFQPTVFEGYIHTGCQGVVQVLLHDSQEVDALPSGQIPMEQTGLMITDRTPCYGESGGQMGDTGWAVDEAQGVRVRIVDTQKKDAFFVHHICVEEGVVRVGDTLYLSFDEQRRARLKVHHSATHLLHQALRDILGPHVTQRGSLVTPDKLRFDFSHGARIEADVLKEVQRQVNAAIRQNAPVHTRLMTPKEALAQGALGLFGEKYGAQVRMVAMTLEEDKPALSMELCGGTHVDRTGDIGFFKILSESGVAAGIRRIEAVAGEVAEDAIAQTDDLMRQICGSLKTNPPQLLDHLHKVLQDARTGNASSKLSPKSSGETLQVKSSWETLGSHTAFVWVQTQGLSSQEMKGQLDVLKKEALGKKVPSGVIAIGQVEDGRTTLILGATDCVWDVKQILHNLLAPWGGKGGGRSDLAQGGWSEGPSLADALEALRLLLTQETSKKGLDKKGLDFGG